MIAKIFNDSGVQVGRLEDSQITGFIGHDLLDGVGTATLYINTTNEMVDIMNIHNKIEIYDTQNNSDILLWAGHVGDYSVSDDQTVISLMELKHRLNSLYSESTETITTIQQLLQKIKDEKGIDFEINVTDPGFGKIQVKIGNNFYSYLEEVRKATGLDWDYDGEKIIFGVLGRVREDVYFSGGVTGSQCGNSNIIGITDPVAKYSTYYTKVVVYGDDDVIVTAGTGSFEKKITSESDDVTFLQNLADEELINNSRIEVFSFSVSSLNGNTLNVGDYVSVFNKSRVDILNTNKENAVRILKKEIIKNSGCDIKFSIEVGSVKNITTDDFNTMLSLRI